MPKTPTQSTVRATPVRIKKGILAIAIEDRVDLWFSASKDQPLLKDGEEILAGINSSYLAKVRSLLRTLVQRLIETLKCDNPKITANDWFGSIGSTVVSIPGVVHDMETIVQLPLIRPSHAGQDFPFHFPSELSAIFEHLLEEEVVSGDKEAWFKNGKTQFELTVRVLNDATAAALGEYRVRRDKTETNRNQPHRQDHNLSTFVYLKIHGGINASVVGPVDGSTMTFRPAHSEAGHSFPILHELDFDAQFEGICEYHHKCYEGMMAIQSFTRRAAEAKNPTFKSWNKKLVALKEAKEGYAEIDGRRYSALDNELLKDILKDPKGVELYAWYAAQLTFQLALILAPEHMVLGGKLATKEVLGAIRANIEQWANNYPKRDLITENGEKLDVFSKDGLEAFIVPARACGIKETIEVNGAYLYAEIQTKRVGYIKPVP